MRKQGKAIKKEFKKNKFLVCVCVSLLILQTITKTQESRIPFALLSFFLVFIIAPSLLWL